MGSAIVTPEASTYAANTQDEYQQNKDNINITLNVTDHEKGMKQFYN